jgi:apolipoprotein D and lipocalin family protein
MYKTFLRAVLFIFIVASLFAGEPFQKTVEYVDTARFSGDWYVIALLPSFIEKNAVNGIETYTFTGDNKVHVRYVFNRKSPKGRRIVTTQRGWIIDKETNAEWRVQPLWPFRLPYLILDLADDYSYTVVGTNNYKYVWIMAREPYIPEKEYQLIIEDLEERGYPVDKIRVMPQEW